MATIGEILRSANFPFWQLQQFGYYNHFCRQCRHKWNSIWASEKCPNCDHCEHRCREHVHGCCESCFGGIEWCSACGMEVQHHEAFCPEDEMSGWMLIGSHDLKLAAGPEGRQAILCPYNSDIEVRSSSKDGWLYSVWVKEGSSPETEKEALSLIGIWN